MKLHRWIIGIFALVLGLGIVSRTSAVTALYNSTIRIVDSTGTVLGGIASATTAGYTSTVRVVDSSGNVLDALGASTTIYPNTAPSSGQIPIGNAGGTAYAPVTMSQDCTITNLGVITCTKTGNVSFGTFATANAATPPVIGNTTPAAGTFSVLVGSTSLAVASDNAVTSLPRMPLDFPIAATIATTSIEYGVHLTVKALTIENAIISVQSFTCAGNPTFKIRDCGTDIACGGAITDIATSASISATGASAMTINSANVAAAHYLVGEFSAGTCTIFNAAIAAMARPQ